MNKLSSILFICIVLMTYMPCYAQNDSLLNRITRQLQQHQTSVNEYPGYPDSKQIRRDLVGHSLAEGVTNGYRSEDWRWTIEKGQISNLRIVQVLSKKQNEYIAIVQMRLSNGYCSYKAKVKVKYTKDIRNQWEMSYVISEGMHVIVTHEYDSFVQSAIVDDGWGGTYCLKFTNKSELYLAIGGDIRTNNGWRRFSILLKPNKTETVGGVLNGGSVEDYRINFIVRDH